MIDHAPGCRCAVCKIGLPLEDDDFDRLADVWAQHRSETDGEVNKLRAHNPGAPGSPRWCALQAIASARQHWRDGR